MFIEREGIDVVAHSNLISDRMGLLLATVSTEPSDKERELNVVDN
jgi:hypothetical protein